MARVGGALRVTVRVAKLSIALAVLSSRVPLAYAQGCCEINQKIEDGCSQGPQETCPDRYVLGGLCIDLLTGNVSNNAASGKCVPLQSLGSQLPPISLSGGACQTTYSSGCSTILTGNDYDCPIGPDCAEVTSTGRDYSFYYDPPVPGTYVFDTNGSASDFDTVLYARRVDVVSGSAFCTGGPQNSLGCNNDATGLGGHSRLILELDPSEPIVVIVDGFNGDTGAFQLNVNILPTPTATPTETNNSTATPTATPSPRAPRNFAYVTTFGNPDSLRVVDTLTNTLTDDRIDVELGAEFVTVTPDGSLAYVSGQNGLTVVDTSNLAIVKQFSVFEPSGIERPVGRVAFSRDGSTAYVVNGDPAALSEIDTSTNDFIGSILLGAAFRSGAQPGGIGVTADGIAYLTPQLLDEGSSIVAVDLTERAVVATIESPCEFAISQDLAMGPDDQRVYVPLFSCRPISGGGSGAGVKEDCPGDCDRDEIVSLDEVITGVNIALGTRDPSTCPNFASDSTAIIDDLVSAVENAMNGCFPPQPLEGNGVAVVRTDNNTIFKVIPFGSIGPGGSDSNAALQPRGAPKINGTGIDITPDGRSLYVAGCDIPNLVCVIDTTSNTVRARVPAFVAGQTAYDVAVTPDGRLAYVTQSTAAQVAVIEVRTNTTGERLFIPENRGVAAGRRP